MTVAVGTINTWTYFLLKHQKFFSGVTSSKSTDNNNDTCIFVVNGHACFGKHGFSWHFPHT